VAKETGKDKINYAMSRRRLTGIIVLSLFLSGVFVGLDHSFFGCKWQQLPKSEDQAKASDFEKYHAKAFIVKNVVDGDTIDIDISDGKYEHTRIRLWGVDTPETKHPQKDVMYFGPEATEFTKGLVLDKQVTIYLEEHRTRGYYGRLLAYVQLADGRYLNEVLLTEGLAYADTRFRHSFYHKYKQLEAVARSGKKGLWKNVTPEQMPQWRQK
jgi:endonuclease YncB( thermonuclease family)